MLGCVRPANVVRRHGDQEMTIMRPITFVLVLTATYLVASGLMSGAANRPVGKGPVEIVAPLPVAIGGSSSETPTARLAVHGLTPSGRPSREDVRRTLREMESRVPQTLSEIESNIPSTMAQIERQMLQDASKYGLSHDDVKAQLRDIEQAVRQQIKEMGPDVKRSIQENGRRCRARVGTHPEGRLSRPNQALQWTAVQSRGRH